MLGAASLSAAAYTVTNTNDSGAGSLRQAIIDSNISVGVADTIAFNVSGVGCDGAGVCTITPESALPSLTDAVVVDGYTQPGATPNTNAVGAITAVLKSRLGSLDPRIRGSRLQREQLHDPRPRRQRFHGRDSTGRLERQQDSARPT